MEEPSVGRDKNGEDWVVRGHDELAYPDHVWQRPLDDEALFCPVDKLVDMVAILDDLTGDDMAAVLAQVALNLSFLLLGWQLGNVAQQCAVDRVYSPQVIFSAEEAANGERAESNENRVDGRELWVLERSH